MRQPPLMRLPVRPPPPPAGEAGNRGDAQRKTAEMRRVWMHSVIIYPGLSCRERAIHVAVAMHAAGWQVTCDAVRSTAAVHDPQGAISRSVLGFVGKDSQARAGEQLRPGDNPPPAGDCDAPLEVQDPVAPGSTPESKQFV
jgi:hypothetical protein